MASSLGDLAKVSESYSSYASRMTKQETFEYKVVSTYPNLQTRLNRWGVDGWRVVGVLAEGEGASAELILERPVAAG